MNYSRTKMTSLLPSLVKSMTHAASSSKASSLFFTLTQATEFARRVRSDPWGPESAARTESKIQEEEKSDSDKVGKVSMMLKKRNSDLY